MSYALELNDKAQRGLGALPPELQEDVLDELDRLAADPDSLVFRGTSPDAIHDVVRQVGDSRLRIPYRAAGRRLRCTADVVH